MSKVKINCRHCNQKVKKENAPYGYCLKYKRDEKYPYLDCELRGKK